MIERIYTGGRAVKKYFFFDIDGTLTKPLTAEIPPSTVKALHGLAEQGHFIALATGRLQADAWQVAQGLGISSVVSDGGMGITIKSRLIRHGSLPLEPCRQMLEHIDSRKHPWAAVPDNKMIRISRDSHYQNTVEDRYYKTIVDPSFCTDHVPVLYKIFIACMPEEEKEIRLFGLPHVRFGRDTMLIEPTDKAAGIREIMRYFGADDKQIVVFGDGMNDLSMFIPGWTSIAMGNARSVLKEKASYITDTVGRDGIWKACLHFGWIRENPSQNGKKE